MGSQAVSSGLLPNDPEGVLPVGLLLHTPQPAGVSCLTGAYCFTKSLTPITLGIEPTPPPTFYNLGGKTQQSKSQGKVLLLTRDVYIGTCMHNIIIISQL